MTSWFPALYRLIKKLPLIDAIIDSLQPCGEMLHCQHRVLVFLSMCEMLGWHDCCSLALWFSDYVCLSFLTPPASYSDRFGCPLYLFGFRFSGGGRHMCGTDVLSCMHAARPAPSHLTSSRCHFENTYSPVWCFLYPAHVRTELK